MRSILLLTLLLFALNSFAQTKLTIQSPNERSAQVATSDRNGAFGDEGFQAESISNGDGTFNLVRGLLEFDLSSIPQGSFVNWARLNLFSVGLNFGANTSLLRRITTPWDPSTVTWNNQPQTSKRGTVILPRSTNARQDYKNINVWTLVQAMVDSPNTSFGFEIKLDTERGKVPSDLLFFTPGYNKPHFNPKLVMEFTAPGMKPAVTSMAIDGNGSSTVMTVYPNPSTGLFTCSIRSNEEINMSLRVLDMMGRTVYSEPVNSSNSQLKIQLPENVSGTYFVTVQDNKNETIVYQELQVN